MSARSPRRFAALDPDGDEILFVVGSDHGMEVADRTIDLESLLVAAGLKRPAQSSDVVVAANGGAALLYFAEPESALVAAVARFLDGEAWVGEVFTGDGLATVGLPTRTAARIAIALKTDGRANPYGVPGRSPVVRDAQEPQEATGFGQHGGLGCNEQSPFLFVAGGGFEPGDYLCRSALIDIAPSVLRHLGLAAQGLDGRPLPQQRCRGRKAATSLPEAAK
jgi:hypothetical protein